MIRYEENVVYCISVDLPLVVVPDLLLVGEQITEQVALRNYPIRNTGTLKLVVVQLSH